jgi:site-specific DNA-methyltransferase (adenine-specific)
MFTLHNGDCLKVMPTLEAGSIDAIITDLPYGTTQNAWDEIIPLVDMWREVKRVLKPSGAFITTSNQPFTSILICSNLEWFKWDDVWMKDKATGHLNAEIMPMRKHESILVFGDGRITYNPQITMKPKENIRPISRRAPTDSYGKYNETADRKIPLNMSYPSSIVYCHTTNHGERGLHPTQKPIELYRYLIRTYTNEGETVLDIAMGSGTTS